MGKNLIAGIPFKIAQFNKLDNLQNYTGHSYRRTAASWAAEEGADLLSLKRIGGWKSSTVCEGYIDDSMALKQRLATYINPETKEKERKEKKKEKDDDEKEDSEENPPKKIKTFDVGKGPLNILNNYNCQITINMK